MTELVFLLEERSMTEVLKIIVPSLVPQDVVCRYLPHEGKQDLEKSIPRKLRAWKAPGVQFVVVRDKDAGDCKKVKSKLLELCKQGFRPDTLVRVVCPHLESWFLGDLAAVEKAYGMRNLAKKQTDRQYSNPDRLQNAEQELRRLIPRYQKISGSRHIAPHMAIESNKSKSFQVFIDGIRHLSKSNRTSI
ncbi:MAG: DUF4276 family protein [Pirellulales bacterium]|nr:DUF4276 family protein [Pirellulales bacterium]